VGRTDTCNPLLRFRRENSFLQNPESSKECSYLRLNFSLYHNLYLTNVILYSLILCPASCCMKEVRLAYISASVRESKSKYNKQFWLELTVCFRLNKLRPAQATTNSKVWRLKVRHFLPCTDASGNRRIKLTTDFRLLRAGSLQYLMPQVYERKYDGFLICLLLFWHESSLIWFDMECILLIT
jgi:hypothetical protein